VSRVLLTGSSGFIGSHLLENLMGRGSSVKCVLRKNSNTKWIDSLPYGCVYADFRDPDTLKEAVKDVDEIYHLGGIVRVTKKCRYYETNSEGTRNLVEAVKKYNPDLKKFVYVSSQAAWGPQGKGPVSHYGMSKAEGETWVKEIENYAIVRPVAVYGPRDSDFLEVFKLALKGLFLKPRKAGKLSFIHVSDCVDGIINAAPGTETFLSDGRDYDWHEVRGALENAVEKKLINIEIPVTILRIMGCVGTLTGKITGCPSKLNYDKVREMTGGDWVVPETAVEAKYDLEAGFKQTYSWYNKMGLI
jgi:nucleoside-diphosphate-sugar epimerase